MPAPSSDEYRLAFAIGQLHCSPTLPCWLPYPTCFVLPGPHSDLRAQLQLQLRPLLLLLLLLLLLRVVCSPSRMQSRVSNGACRKIPSARYDQERGRRGKHGDISRGTEESTLLDGWPSRRNRVTSPEEMTKWRGRARTCSTLCCLHSSLPHWVSPLLLADKVTDLWGELYRLADSAYRLHRV